MKLKRIKKPRKTSDKLKSFQEAETVEEVKPVKKRQKNTLPSDKYEPMFQPLELWIEESTKKLTFEITRDDEWGLPCVVIRTFSYTPLYEGELKNKKIEFPLWKINEFITSLYTLYDISDEKGILSEIKDMLDTSIK